MPPGIEARMPISSGCASVSQTLTVAHRSASSARAGAAASANSSVKMRAKRAIEEINTDLP